MASFDEFINSIIADGNDGKAFELFCKRFLETAPEYKDQFEKVWLWDQWPKKWSHDKGIDLIAKYKGRDTYCAIQAKCYAAHNTVPYDEVTNFLADSNRSEIEDRILMMSTNRLNEKTSKEVIQGQEKQVVIRDRHYFESINFNYPSHISELSNASLKPKAEPRKHQVKAIADVEKGLIENDRGQLIMACGTGKTFTTLWIKERLRANTVLVLLPSLSLLSQTMREWVWGASEQFEALAVCSDPTVGKSKKGDEDISTAEVGRVTWHVEEIKSFLTSTTPKVIFCTYQSSELIEEAQRDAEIPAFDLVVCDEAHRCAGKADAGFATVLHDDKIRAKKRLFTTATPRYYGKSVKSAAEGRGVEIIGMDDESKFGPVLHKLTFGQAIEMDMLTDYQVVVVGVDEPMVRDWIADGEIISTGKDHVTDARTLASKIAVLKAIKDYDLTRVISFHGNIKRAKDFAQEVDQVSEIIDAEQRPSGKIWSEHVDGTMSAGKRRDLINNLKGLDGFNVGLLTNARCLSEGVDVPSLDGIAFVDPRGSQVDIIQAVGRAIRKSDNKTKGTIVLPVFLEAGDDPDEVISASNFKPIWTVIKALRSHDDELSKPLDQYRTELGLGGGDQNFKLDKIIFDLPINITEEFSHSLKTVLIESTTESWGFWYGLYKKYILENGSLKIDQKYKTEEGLTLGAWVNSQRFKFKNNQLSSERIMQLELIEGWEWDPFEAQWHRAFELFKRYFSVEGSTRIHKELVYENFGLGSWVHQQRQNRSKLGKQKEKLLESFPDWLWSPRSEKWDQNFNSLKNYIEKYGCIPIKGKVDDEGNNIGNWAVKQRNRRKDLTKERQKRLENLSGWVWHADDAKWEEAFGELQSFYFREPEARLVQSYSTKSGLSLGSWASAQRVNFNKGKLEPEKIQKLESISQWVWDVNEADWQRGFNFLKKFVARENTALVPRGSFIEGYNLANWVTLQRTNREVLDETKKSALESLPGWTWNVLLSEWFGHLESLQNFVEINGHCIVPQDYQTDDGFGLAVWVRRNRQRLADLCEEQIEALKTIPGFFGEPEKIDTWEEYYLLLQKFVEVHDHARPADDGSKLGGWVRQQRSNYKKHKLSAEQITRLEALNGWVWNFLEWQWDQGVIALKAFVDDRATCSVPQTYVSENGVKLASWINSQRTRYKNSKLSDARIKKLEEIEFWSWDPFAEVWNKNFNNLKRYVERFGTADVSSNYIDEHGNRLGQWVHVQRHDRNRISSERKQLLEGLPGWLWIKEVK